MGTGGFGVVNGSQCEQPDFVASVVYRTVTSDP
jgi:hypothetical protein